MKYFTLDDWISDQGDEFRGMDVVRQIRQEYEDYLVSVADRMPPDLLQLHQTVRLYDGALRSLEVNIGQKQAIFLIDTYPIDAANRLHLRAIILQYDQVSSFHSTADPQKGLFGHYGYGDIGNDEFELLADGLFEHRLVFSSGVHLSIKFRGFSFRDVKEQA